MKKTVFLIPLIIFIAGCVSLEYIPAYEQIRGLDLRPYAEKNFLITPYTYPGKYTSVGIIDYKTMPSARLINISQHDAGGERYNLKNWIINTIDSQSALDSIYFLCRDMGANALVSFEILEVSDNYSNITNPVVISGIRITGLAIRRDDIE